MGLFLVLPRVEVGVALQVRTCYERSTPIRCTLSARYLSAFSLTIAMIVEWDLLSTT